MSYEGHVPTVQVACERTTATSQSNFATDAVYHGRARPSKASKLQVDKAHLKIEDILLKQIAK